MTEINDAVRAMLMEAGAAMAGFGDMRPLPPAERLNLPFGVSFAVLLNPAIVKNIYASPTIEYWREYERANLLLDDIGHKAAALIEASGYRAVPLLRREMTWDREQYSTFLPHKTVATRAGLGWIGKCALLVTRPFGAMIRLSSVLTDAPLETDRPVSRSFCGKCTICADNCPGRAVSGRDWTPGMPREVLFDARACADACDRLCQPAGIEETICGRCIRLCPWTERYLRSVGVLTGIDRRKEA